MEAVVVEVTLVLHQLQLLEELLPQRQDEPFHQQPEKLQQLYVSWIKYSASFELWILDEWVKLDWKTIFWVITYLKISFI